MTEHGHASRIAAGENAGTMLEHHFVVPQYVPVGSYSGAARLSLQPIAADPTHPRQINLGVTNVASGAVIRALSLSCMAAG